MHTVISTLPLREGDTDLEHRFRWVVSATARCLRLFSVSFFRSFLNPFFQHRHVVSWIANPFLPSLPLPQAWGIGTFVRFVKFIRGRFDIAKESTKGINAVIGCAATAVDTLLRLGITGEKYQRTAKQKKTAFLVVIYQTIHILLGLGVVGTETFETFFTKDPRPSRAPSRCDSR